MEIVFTLPHVFCPGSNGPENAAVLELSLKYLIALDVDYLKRHSVPPLYSDGVYYKRTVEWEPIPAVQARGYGDCKSLTAWKVAEYLVAGIPARAVFRYRPRSDGQLDYHILILLANGKWEDPSKVLGMTGAENGAVSRDPLDELLASRRLGLTRKPTR